MRLEQVVTNLMSNAIKYTPAGGRLEISLLPDNGEAVLTVSDNGIGMTADFLPTIFTIFVQAERSLDRNSAGLGLGLALVHQLIELHRGTVRAFSDGLGHGSVFVVRLPISTAKLLSPLMQRLTQDAATSKARKVLVVDGNNDAAESTAMLLRLDGHKVRVAPDGPSALQVAADFLPDVVLLDIGLPGMDGCEVCRQLRATSESADTMLIALSGYAGDDHRERARQAGFDVYLVKPAGMKELNNIISSPRHMPGNLDRDSSRPRIDPRLQALKGSKCIIEMAPVEFVAISSSNRLASIGSLRLTPGQLTCQLHQRLCTELLETMMNNAKCPGRLPTSSTRFPTRRVRLTPAGIP